MILGRSGHWRNGRIDGAFYCHLSDHPSWPNAYSGAIMMVPVDSDGLLVRSLVP